MLEQFNVNIYFFLISSFVICVNLLCRLITVRLWFIIFSFIFLFIYFLFFVLSRYFWLLFNFKVTLQVAKYSTGNISKRFFSKFAFSSALA